MSAPTAVVTGGSRGIGAAIAERLAADGYAVAVNYAGSRQKAVQVVARIVDAGGSAVAVQADVRDPAAITRMFDEAAALGPLAVLVNNGGVSGPTVAMIDQQDDDLRELLDINVLGVWLASRAAVRLMSTAQGGPGGSIVNIASVAARTGGLPGLAAYAATKAAVVTFTRGLSSEVAGKGIRVNSVSPGLIETDMTTDDMRAMASGSTPVGRIGRPSDVADTVSWLVSDGASFVTGADITVSGGR